MMSIDFIFAIFLALVVIFMIALTVLVLDKDIDENHSNKPEISFLHIDDNKYDEEDEGNK